MRDLARWMAFPVVLFGGLAAVRALHVAGLGEFLSVAFPVLVASGILLALQRWIPFEDGWRGRPADFGLDLLHMITTSTAGELWRAAVFGLAVKASLLLAGVLGATLWPSSWPLVAQLALAMVLGDLGAYVAHRACHELPLFWRVHAMHHSSERLYVFAASRSHPLNFVLVWAAAAMPLLVLGCPDEVLVLVGAFTALHGMLQHANVDFRHGLFNHVFATADLHRWHHSADFAESNSNYGSTLILWDQVFGTRFLPDDRRAPTRLGLDGVGLPENWFSHLASPFVLDRYTIGDLPELDDFTLENAVSTGVPAGTAPAAPSPASTSTPPRRPPAH